MRSLELNWIRKKVDKSIILPEFIIDAFDYASGMYITPRSDIYTNKDNKEYSLKNGAILISDIFGSDIEGVIAHEWRHHWQCFNGIELKPVLFNEDIEYEDALKTYFKSSKVELDALRFEYKFSKIPELWEFVLLDFIKDLKPKKMMLTF